MLLGMAEALALELNVNDNPRQSDAATDGDNRLQRRYWERRVRVRVLIYIHKAQSSRVKLREHDTNNDDFKVVQELSRMTTGPESECLSALVAWGKLSRLSNKARPLLSWKSRQSAISAMDNEHLVRLKHFTTLLDGWSQDRARLRRKCSPTHVLSSES